jgi:hypothetical protein
VIGTAKLQKKIEMTYYEILKLSKEPIDRLNSAGFRLEDCQYLALYEDYKRMHEAGDKMTYIVSVLHDRYHVCERKVYDLIKRFGRHCTIGAV